MSIKDLMPWNWSDKKEVPVKKSTDPIQTLHQEMNQLFDNFFSRGSLAPFGNFGDTFQPRVDVTETDTQFELSAELPGMDEKDIELKLTHNTLTISGEKKQEKEDKSDGHYYMERSYGSFQRVIPFGVAIETDKVDAVFKNGVLTVTLPKTAEAQKARKRIPVKTA